MLGAIEAGGTKFVCAVGDETGHIIEQIQIPTTIPEETMPRVITFFSQYPVKAIGVGSFGTGKFGIWYDYFYPKGRVEGLSIRSNVKGCLRGTYWF